MQEKLVELQSKLSFEEGEKTELSNQKEQVETANASLTQVSQEA